MFDWISFKDRNPEVGDFIIAWDGAYYAVGEWCAKRVYDDGIVIPEYLSSEVGACCHTEFKDEDIKLWAYVTEPKEEQNV